MALKTGLSLLALGALLLGSTAARADDTQGWDHDRSAPVHDATTFHYGGAGFEVHVHTGGCDHGPQPQPPPRQRGHYELQTVQRWVEGYHTQVWVPEQCHYKPHRNVTKCRGGYYEQQWVPGRYETVQEWVWVPGPRWGRRHGGW